MLRMFRIEAGAIRELETPADGEARRALLREADWIDAQEPDAQERALLESLLNMEVPGAAEAEEIMNSARCFVDQSGIHVHSLFLVHGDDRYRTESVICILQKTRLITVSEHRLPDFRLLRMRAKRGQVSSDTPAQLLITLLEQKVENHADVLEGIHFQLEEIGRKILEERNAELQEAISELARLEDSNGKVRLCLMDTQRDISFLLRHLQPEPGQADTLREIMRDLETLMSHTEFLFDKINFLMESTQGFIHIQQGQTIKILSIAAVVFLPPTLIASVYGMNFEHMPELNWRLGYPWALGLMLLAALGSFLYLKSKRWL